MDINEIALKIEKYDTQLQKLDVAVIYLFGSQKEGIGTSLSDIDLGVVLNDTKALKDMRLMRRKYIDLTEIFINVFSHIKKEIDIVFLQQASIVFQHQVITNGEIIYEKMPEFRANYEEQIISQYMDFKPLLDYSQNIIIERAG